MGNLGRRALVLVFAALAMSAMAACGSDDDGGDSADSGGEGGAAKQGGSVTISQTSQPDYLDPALSYTVNGWEPQWLVYTPPVTYKRAEGVEGTELIPGVAEELPKVSEDGKTVTFTIRKGLKFSDGTPVKASRLGAHHQARAQPGVRRHRLSSWSSREPRSTSTPASPTATSPASRPTTRPERSRSR